MDITSCPSPNFGKRRNGILPELIVLHYTAMTSAEVALERLCDPQFEVSAHYLISTAGTCYQMVDEAARAWHAGAGEWAGFGDVNSRSIGIELDNDGSHPFSEAQMLCLECLIASIQKRWDIGPAGVIGHSDFAPLRKVDPGPRFDWRRLAMMDQAIWSEQDTCRGIISEDRFITALARIGYPTDAVAAPTLVKAFRLRFRPWGSGALCQADLGRAEDLAHRYPVDGRDMLT
ncbi:MAG: N-acetylmuramoyl-L-alanine amidase [Pseudoruegeria sp.]